MNESSNLDELRPVLSGIKTADEVIGLTAHELLHAGPPLQDPQHPPPVLMSAAVMTALHEGWAGSEQEAEKLVRNGTIRWRCAQDHQCVAPLAATISPSTPLFEVTDSSQQQTPRYSMVSPVRGADTRMGSRDAGLLERLAARDTQIAPAFSRWLNQHGPVALWPIAQAGLASGDDLHYRTTGASQALGQMLAQSNGGNWCEAVGDTPTYFLTLWMAACAMLLDAGGKGSGQAAVVKVGGNGACFGIGLANAGGRWVSETASPPVGARMPGAETTAACPAIGDSAVIDIAGFGAQGLQTAAEARESFAGAGVLPPDHASIAASIGLAEFKGLGEKRWTGVNAEKVAHSGTTPLIALAMLAKDGQRGLLGRGLYRTEYSLFRKALTT